MAKMIAALALIALFASPAIAQLCSDDALGLCGIQLDGNSCQCDSGCGVRGDCCTDVCETCDLACPATCADQGTGPGGNLCETIVASNACQCDVTCSVTGDCCDDVCDTCGIACPSPAIDGPFPPLPPNGGVCAQIGCSENPVAFSDKNACFCDSACVFFNDCCDDACEACDNCKFGNGLNNKPGDSPLNAITVDASNLPQIFTVNNDGFGNILDNFGPEVFFNFTAVEDIIVYITVCEADFDTGIVIYDFFNEENPTDFDLTTVIATDNDPQWCGEGTTGSGTAINVPAFETAIIQVEAILATGIGNFTLVVNEAQPTCADGIFNFCQGVTTTPQTGNPIFECFCGATCTAFNSCCSDYQDSCLGAVCDGESGDVTLDGIINVLDIINISNFIVGGEDPGDDSDDCVEVLGDVNSDGDLSVLDIVNIVNSILGIDGP